ncbi:NAD-dependent epimerase/dehydratase family protein [Gammaproteobacteria bacterium]|nr:NAD-dependent epimerase/dehydratase family protein [Gammaproteobacteria bacterium]
MKYKKVLVTGASGFIGSHCVIDLIDHGYQVVGTIRDISRESTLRKIFSKLKVDNGRVSFKKADLRNSQEVVLAMDGCDSIFHIASPVPIVQPKTRDGISELMEAAEIGTLNVLKAAMKKGIDRIILTSSVATIFGNEIEKNTYDSSDWANPEGKSINPYSKSKILAEQAAWRFCNKNSMNLTSIHPSLVLGPALESDYGSSLEAIIKILRKELPLIPNFGFEIVDVRDTASLHRIAMESSNAIGKRLVASQGFMWFKTIAEIIDRSYPEKKVPTRVMPDLLTRSLSILIPELRQITNDLGREKRISNEESVALGWAPRKLEDTIIDSAESLISLGFA